MGKRGDHFKSQQLRARVRQMLEAGYSEARMARETGQSARHIALIAGQERVELAAGQLADALLGAVDTESMIDRALADHGDDGGAIADQVMRGVMGALQGRQKAGTA